MSQIAAVLWFAVAWIFILAVVFKHWYANDRRQAERTDAALARTKSTTDNSHIWDA